MSEEQTEVLNQFKKYLADNNVTENPWLNDVQLLKFCRARSFDLQKIIAMFTAYMEYRTENKIDTIVGVSDT